MKKLILIILLLSLTGCWNYSELNNLAITTGIAIDINENEFEVTILISNSQKQTKASQIAASSAVYSGKGRTIFEAIKDTSMAISKQIYLSHIEVLVLSSEVAKTRTQDVIDFFFRYPQTRNEFYVVIADNCAAKEIFEVTTPLETFPSQNISKNLEITDKLQGYTYTVTLNEFVKDIMDKGKNPLLPTISIIGDKEKGNADKNIERNKPEAYLKLGMMAIFNGFSYVKTMDKDESAGINIINNRIETSLLKIPYKNGFVVIELNGCNTKIKFKNKFEIKVKAVGSIEEINGNINIDKEKEIEVIRELGKNEIKRLITSVLTLSQKEKIDILGLENIIYRNNYKYWDTIKNNFDEQLGNFAFDIDINLELKTKGKINSIVQVN